MIALERKDSMKGNCEASIKCLQGKGFPCKLKIEGFLEVKDENDSREGLDIVEPEHPKCREFIKNETHCKPTFQPDYSSWFAFPPDSQKFQHRQMNAFENQFYPLPVDNRSQFAHSGIFPHGCMHEFQIQDFQYFVVIDFEATCDKEKIPNPQEIIEFPSVIVSSLTGQLEASFQIYVRPTCNQLLSDFCKDLTGIQQIQVDRGVSLSEALLMHDKWLEEKGIKNNNFAVVTWSNWDCRVMLESECQFKKIRKPPYFNRWINLRVPFRKVFGGVRCNLKEAVELAGLKWEGRAHCGLDDAKNTARLLALLMHQGFKFSITNSLMWQTADRPLTMNPCPSFPPHQPLKPKDQYIPLYQFHPYCFCGVKSSKGMVHKPGPKQGSIFFGCGNWTFTRGARCHYFEWASR